MQTYNAVRDQNQDALRRSVIASAESLLLSQGAAAVTVRRVAQQISCSTTVIYNLFGSKDGLSNALYRDGCDLLHAALIAAPHQGNPTRYLADLGWAYWDFAERHPQYYTLMFSGALPEFTPSPASLQDVATAIGVVVSVLEGYRSQGVLITDDVQQTAMMIWASLHGVIQLFFAGHLGDARMAKATYERTLITIIGALLVE
jgi:AcrR family transcriptional regulator